MELSLKLSDIPENRSRTLTGTISQEESPRITEILGDSETLLDYTFDVSRSGDTVTLRGEVSGCWHVACDLCLKEFEFEFNEDFHQILIPESSEETPIAEVLLVSEELETDFYQGEIIHFAEILEDQALLALPTKMICQESCLGLCPQCGMDLNTDSCRCSEKIDPEHPFAALLPK